MFANYAPEHVFMVLTHVDLDRPSEEFICGKIASFKNTGGIQIPRENVILFDNT
jgi:hypothetical protein